MPKKRIPFGCVSRRRCEQFVADYVTHRQPRAPLTGVRLARYPMYFDSDKSIKELGLPQNSIYQALLDEIEWLLEQGIDRTSFTFTAADLDAGFCNMMHVSRITIACLYKASGCIAQ